MIIYYLLHNNDLKTDPSVTIYIPICIDPLRYRLYSNFISSIVFIAHFIICLTCTQHIVLLML